MKFVKPKFMAMFLCFALILSIISGSVMAKGTVTSDNEYGFELIQNDENFVIAKGTHNGDELYGTLDKNTGKYSLRAVERPKTFLRIGSEMITEYRVEVENLDPTKNLVEATIIDTRTNQSFELSTEAINAQLPVLVGIVVWGGTALLEYLAAHAVSITIAGVITYAITELATNIRNNKKVDYWPAWIRNNTVYVSQDGFETRGQALAWINKEDSGEYNVMAKKESQAESLAGSRSGASATIWHPNEQKDGYFPHYHPVKQFLMGGSLQKQQYHNHIWYVIPK
ncbi:hypothetical protein ACFCP7_27680 [Paenibacillus elgii]